MRSGTLRDRGNILQDSSNADTPTQDFTGSPLVANWPCQITAVGGDETYRGRQLESTVDYVVAGRAVNGVLADNQFYATAGIHKGKTLNIDTVHYKLDKQNTPILELYCTEKTT
jgi:hypothetical protein